MATRTIRRQHCGGSCKSKTTKKAEVTEHPKVFDPVGLHVNEPPGRAELLSI